MYCALVDGEGENVDFIKLSHFMKRENSRIEQEKEDKVNQILFCLINILYTVYGN